MRVLQRVKASAPYMIVLAAGAFLYYKADHFDFAHAPGRIGPDAWPKLILAIMIAVAMWGVVTAFFAKEASQSSPPVEAEEAALLVHPPEVYPWFVWFGVAATLAFLFLLPILGFFIASVIYVAIFTYIARYRNPVGVLALSLLLPLVFMILFMRIVYVALPIGIAPFDTASLALMSMIGVH